jgi:hypothetical protein
MNMSKVLTLVVALLAASAVAASALAQQGGQPDSAPATGGSMMDQQPGGHMMGPGRMGGGGPMLGHQGMGRGMGMRGGHGSICGMMSTHIEGRLAFLKAELAITSEQESLWNGYATAVRDNAKSVAARCSSMTSQGEAKPSLPDRLDAQGQFVAARLDALRAVSKALKPLYGALSDTQKQLADELIRSSTGMM